MKFMKKLNICLVKMVLNMKKIKKLISVKEKKEYVSDINRRIEQEEVAEYKVVQVNYECKNIQEIDSIKQKPCLIDCEYIVCEIIEEQNVEHCEIIEEQKITTQNGLEYEEIIKLRSIVAKKDAEVIEEQKAEYCEVEIIEDQKTCLIDCENQKIMKQNGLKYEEIIKLRSIVAKKRG